MKKNKGGENMRGVNKAIIVGNVTKDPELRSTQSGNNVATFSVATNRSWKDQSGQLKEEVDFHNIVVWGPQGVNAHKYLKKGSPVYVEGRISNRKYTAQDGTEKYISEIVAQDVNFLPGNNTDQSNVAPGESSDDDWGM